MENTILAVKSAIAALGGFAAYWLGGLDKLLAALIALLVLDYLTGIIKAVNLRCLSSDVGFRGIAKKVLTLLIVALAFIIEDLTGAALPLREVVIMFFVANEGLSILENAVETGLPVPQRLRETLEQLKNRE